MAKFSFKTNCTELKEWLGKRKTSLEQARAPVEAVWKDIRLHYEPSIGKALLEGDPNQRAAQREDEKIYNSETRILLHRLSAGLQSGITNQARQWFKLETTDKKLSELSTVRQWLDSVTEIVQSVMNRSNVYPALDQIYLHLGAMGSSCALIVADSQNVAHAIVIDEGAYWYAENRRGRVEHLLRREEKTIGNLIEEFGEGWIPDEIMERAKAGRLEEYVTVWNYVCPNDPDRFKDVHPDRPFVSVYWIQGQPDPNAGIIAIRSYGYNPIIGPRWSVFGSVYGVGCGTIGLADAKQLQVLELDKMKLVAQEVDPAMVAPASMKGDPLRTGPGGVNYEPDGITGQGAGARIRRLFETREQIQALLMAIDATEKRMGRIFFTDLFAMMINLNMAPVQKTAREINELSSEKVALLGPILTRLNTDLLEPLVDAYFALANEVGLLPPAPPELEDVKLNVEYVSSLHVDQQSATRMNGLFRLAEFVGMLMQYQPNVVQKINWDEMVDIAAQSLTEHGVVLDDRDVAAFRKGLADQQQAALKAEQMTKAIPAVAGAARDLSETKMDEGSALDGIMGGAR